MFGIREQHPEWIGYSKGNEYIQQYYNELLTMNAIICKKNTPYLQELFNNVKLILDNNLEKLKQNPGYNSGYHQDKLYDFVGDNQYPLRWLEISGEIHHKLMYKFKNHIKYDLPPYEYKAYR